MSGVVVVTTAQLHSAKPERRICADSYPARAVSGIRDYKDLWQWFRLEMRKTKAIHHQIWKMELDWGVTRINQAFRKHMKNLS